MTFVNGVLTDAEVGTDGISSTDNVSTITKPGETAPRKGGNKLVTV
jgi:hypothetical protein